jgi:hypothetical protein
LQKYSKQINMKNLFKLFLILVAFMGAGTSVYSQGNTTSSINGVVYDNGGSFAGSINFGYSLRIGTRYSGSTDFSGNFRISNMREEVRMKLL